jgi:hypothetical protein
MCRSKENGSSADWVREAAMKKKYARIKRRHKLTVGEKNEESK